MTALLILRRVWWSIPLALAIGAWWLADGKAVHWHKIADAHLAAIRDVTGDKKLTHSTAPTLLYRWRTEQATAHARQLEIVISTERQQTHNAMEAVNALRRDRDHQRATVERLRAQARAHPGTRIPTGVSGSATISSGPAGETLEISLSDAVEVDDALHRYARLIDMIQANQGHAR